MDKELKQKWIEALRSGKYKQARETLRSDDNSFCCLGVLCEISGLGEWRGFCYDTENDRSIGFLGLDLTEWADLPAEKQSFLAKMNDDEKNSFSEIADYIEAKL